MIKESGFAPVSVVIPCFRCAATIDRAVDSILAQTMRPAEIILVDDASGDGTLAILNNLEHAHKAWIKVIPLPVNLGAAGARNEGWCAATQPYIAFLDADDSWHPRKIEVQYEYMSRHPQVMLCGHQCVLLNDGEVPPALPENPQVVAINHHGLLFRNPFATPTVMLRKDAPWRFQTGKHYAEDRLLWQQIVYADAEVMRIESPLAYVHKPFYGASGLSANLWRMEKEELANFLQLFRSGQISVVICFAAIIYSILKHIRRLVVAGVRM